MRQAADGLVTFTFLVVGLWVVLFSVAGAGMGARSGVGAWRGMVAGCLLGPIGLAWVQWTARRNGSGPVSPEPPVSGGGPSIAEPSVGDGGGRTL